MALLALSDGSRTAQRNEACGCFFFLQTTWTLFFTSPVVELMRLRGNLCAGAERISAKTLRSTPPFVLCSTPPFVLGTAVDSAAIGGTVGTLSVCVTIRTA